MSNPLDGYFYIPFIEQWAERGGIARIMNFLGPAENIKGVFIAGVEYPFEDGLSALLYGKAGMIKATIAGFTSNIWFQEVANTYISIEITVPEWELAEPKGDPARVELFALKWGELCEVMGVKAAFFSDYGAVATMDHKRKLDNLIQGEISEFVAGWPWRMYLDHDIARTWNEDAPLDQARYAVQSRSGALIIYAGKGYNPVFGDMDLDHHVDFLVEMMREKQEISGVAQLIANLEGEKNGRIKQIYAEIDEGPRYNGPKQGKNGVMQSRIYIDTIRALWAAAYKRPGLVGVNQTVSLTRASGETDALVVPIIADNGQEWLLVSNHDPFAIKDTTWTGVAEDLAPQVRDLLAAAQQHPVAGQPPRVVVFCWKGIADDLRATLEAMGAQIEVAPVPVPLLEP